jgi:hypothetical protein
MARIAGLRGLHHLKLRTRGSVARFRLWAPAEAGSLPSGSKGRDRVPLVPEGAPQVV